MITRLNLAPNLDVETVHMFDSIGMPQQLSATYGFVLVSQGEQGICLLGNNALRLAILCHQ